jgi:hypothetical protein
VPAQRLSSQVPWFALAIVMAVGLAIQLLRLDFQSLWLIEVLTVQNSAPPLSRMVFDPEVVSLRNYSQVCYHAL